VLLIFFLPGGFLKLDYRRVLQRAAEARPSVKRRREARP
jgi:hypothetical protein